MMKKTKKNVRIKPSLVQLPEPKELWSENNEIAVLYCDISKWFQIQDDSRFSINYFNNKDIIYNELNKLFIKPIAEIDLFEGKATVYFQVATGSN